MTNVGHTSGSTEFAGDSGARVYDLQLHGEDGALLLDPYLTEGLAWIANSGAQRAIDIGSGTGPWSRRLHDLGVGVVALESSEAMHTRALEKNLKGVLHANGVRPGVIPVLADGLDMSLFGDETFHAAISVNVGCNIQNLSGHFAEMARVLKLGGVGVVTAPVNLDKLFHKGQDSEDMAQIIDYWLEDEPRLGTIGFAPDLKKRHSMISYSVLRATIKLDEHGNPSHQMKPEDKESTYDGEPVWRIIPGGLVVPNYYHDETAYEEALSDSGFEVERKVTAIIDKESPVATEFSETYREFNPFAVYTIIKVD